MIDLLRHPIARFKAWRVARRRALLHVLTPEEATIAIWGLRARVFWTRVIVVFLVAALVAVVAAQSARDTAQCNGQKTGRSVLTQLTLKAFSQNSGSLDLTAIAGYDLIADAGTKEWVDSFNALIARGAASTIVDKNKNHVPDDIDALLAEKVC